ncbi:unnamed protein product [Moneuplotes crassus]|uniref:Uncharacterized protein n=1 Tax=Euplotes crassus TaxID=5936 RepID=A0AAD1U322_EUPCR|nr:unnamed protein product [Moneuplotes crassus]
MKRSCKFDLIAIEFLSREVNCRRFAKRFMQNFKLYCCSSFNIDCGVFIVSKCTACKCPKNLKEVGWEKAS